jgi:uncharacterized membrane protein YoaK (UPF0700 family)
MVKVHSVVFGHTTQNSSFSSAHTVAVALTILIGHLCVASDHSDLHMAPLHDGSALSSRTYAMLQYFVTSTLMHSSMLPVCAIVPVAR